MSLKKFKSSMPSALSFLRDISSILILVLSAGQPQGSGWFKNPVSSKTEKLMAASKFSDYLGIKHYKKAKKTFQSFRVGPATSKFWYIPYYITYGKFISEWPKVCFSLYAKTEYLALQIYIKIGGILLQFNVSNVLSK